MSGQPDLGPGNWKFDLAQVTAHESVGNPPAIILDSSLTPTFTLESKMTNGGAGSGALIASPGTPGVISYYASRMDAASTVIALTPTNFVMNAPTVNTNSASFGTVGPASATSLEPGIWRVVVLVNFPATSFATDVGGFNEIVLNIR